MKLYYFKKYYRGKAEPICLLQAYFDIKLEYVEVSYPFTSDFRKILPFGQVPILQLDDGRYVAQSGTIIKYLAENTKGAVPSDTYERLVCDSIYEEVTALNVITFACNRKEGEEFKELYQANKPKVLSIAKHLSSLLGDKAFFVGDHISYCDFQCFHYLSVAFDVYPEMSEFSNLEAYLQKFKELKGIKEYYSTRPIPIDFKAKTRSIGVTI